MDENEIITQDIQHELLPDTHDLCNWVIWFVEDDLGLTDDPEGHPMANIAKDILDKYGLEYNDPTEA